MKLSEIKGEGALDVLADIIDPVAKICADTEIQKAVKANLPRLAIVKKLLKTHKREIIDIMAYLDGEDPEKYEVNLLTLPVKLLEILNDPDIAILFTSQSQE